MPSTDAAAFWDVAAPLLASGLAEPGTIMGHPCLRIRGTFLAMPYHAGPGMVVKLPRDRVTAIIAAGQGEPFAPAGRIFREWLHVPADNPQCWTDLLAEGIAFASGENR